MFFSKYFHNCAILVETPLYTSGVWENASKLFEGAVELDGVFDLNSTTPLKKFRSIFPNATSEKWCF